MRLLAIQRPQSTPLMSHSAHSDAPHPACYDPCPHKVPSCGFPARHRRNPPRLPTLGTISCIAGLIAGLFGMIEGAACASEERRTKPQPFSVGDLGRMSVITDPQISPDGRFVAFTRTTPDFRSRRYDSEIALVEIATCKVRTLTSGRKEAWHPRWSTTGNRIAFIAPATSRDSKLAQIFITTTNGREPKQLTRVPNGVQQFAWRPGDDYLAFATPDDAPGSSTPPEQRSHAFEVGNDSYLVTSAPVPSHLWVVSSKGGRPERITQGPWSVVPGVADLVMPPISWSPDGRRVAFTRLDTPNSGDSDRMTVCIVDIESRRVDALTGRSKAEGYARFSNDGQSIAYCHYRDGLFWTSVNDVYVTSKRGGAGRNMNLQLDRDIQTVSWSPDDKSLLVTGMNGTRGQAWLLPLDAPPVPVDLGDLNLGCEGSFEISHGRGGDVAFVASKPNQPQELYYKKSPDDPPIRLTTFHADLAGRTLGDTRVIECLSIDGFTNTGVLTLPPTYSPNKPHALVVDIHGGPNWASTLAFDAWSQILANQGYLVFRPNYRGSCNMGNAYQVAFVGNAAGSARDIMEGVAEVKRHWPVDEKRMAVCGWSHGGFLTAWLAGHTKEFKTAIAGAAITDWTDYLALSDINLQVGYYLGGFPWQKGMAEKYASESPVSYASNISMPMLIFHLSGDSRVPITQAFKFYHALRARDVPVRFVVYPESGHHPRDPIHVRDLYSRWLDWLADHLDGQVHEPESRSP